MSKRLNRDVNATINELWNRGIDASHLEDEIARIIADRWDYDPDRHWEEIAKELGLL